MDAADDAQMALVRMTSIRSGARFQVITYSEDDGGADDKRDYASVKEAARAARDYVRGKDEPAYYGLFTGRRNCGNGFLL